jgi:hypothetical protein
MKNFIRNLMLIGFKFTDQELHEATKKVDTIIQTKRPDNTKKLFSFLCSVNFNRGLIQNYDRITAENTKCVRLEQESDHR